MHSFDEVHKIISEVIEKLKFEREPNELYQPIDYILSIGGKRLRPIITLMCCELFDGDIQQAIHPALGMEIFHNFTLMHDDIMDKADLRRGKKTVHARWDENRAILSGDAMLILANQFMMRAEDDILREVMEVYNSSGLLVCDGQQYDMNFESISRLGLEDYIKMIGLKTASLISSCCRLGAVIAKTTPQNKELIENFGYNLGVSFQIEDDVLDVYGDVDKFGKKIGGDIIVNKKTFLWVKAMELADDATLKQMGYWMTGTNHNPDEKIAGMVEIYDNLNIKHHSRQMIKSYYKKSVDYLKMINIPESKKEKLFELADYLVNRES